VVFMFTGVSMTARIMVELPEEMRPAELGGPFAGAYSEVLPYVRSAYAKAIEEFEASVPEDLREELGDVVRHLCDPDPQYRGEPSNRVGFRDRYALDQFVSRFNRLASVAEAGMIRRAGR
jgi:hypothetical protein